MTTAVTLYYYLLSAFVLFLILWGYIRRTHDLLSVRNIALLGLIVFQMTSVAIRLPSSNFQWFRLSDPTHSATIFAAMVTLFLFAFLITYRKGWGAVRLARALPKPRATPGAPFLIAMSIVMTGLAIFLRFGVLIPTIGIIANMVGVGFAAIAAGLVGWVWGRQIYNPVFAFYSAVIVAANLMIVSYGEFGRRSLVTVAACMLWGMYYSNWRYLPVHKTLVRLGVISIVPAIILALYTSVRSSAESDLTSAQHLEKMVSGGNLTSGFSMLLDGQNTGTASLWLVENYPEVRPYRHLFSLGYFFMVPVPRQIWPTKPLTMSVLLASQARVRGVDQNRIKLSVGVVGAAAAEGGFYAAAIYGIALGLLLRFFDEMLLQNPHSPFMVLPVGSALGQVLGLARGDTSVFANTLVITVAFTWFAMLLMAKMLEAFGVATSADDEQLFDEEGECGWEEDHDVVSDTILRSD